MKVLDAPIPEAVLSLPEDILPRQRLWCTIGGSDATMEGFESPVGGCDALGVLWEVLIPILNAVPTEGCDALLSRPMGYGNDSYRDEYKEHSKWHRKYRDWKVFDWIASTILRRGRLHKRECC